MIQLWNYRKAFWVMGICIVCSSVLAFFISIRGHAGFLCGYDAPEVLQKRYVTGRNRLEVEGESVEEAEMNEQRTTVVSTVPK